MYTTLIVCDADCTQRRLHATPIVCAERSGPLRRAQGSIDVQTAPQCEAAAQSDQVRRRRGRVTSPRPRARDIIAMGAVWTNTDNELGAFTPMSNGGATLSPEPQVPGCGSLHGSATRTAACTKVHFEPAEHALRTLPRERCRQSGRPQRTDPLDPPARPRTRLNGYAGMLAPVCPRRFAREAALHPLGGEASVEVGRAGVVVARRAAE